MTEHYQPSDAGSYTLALARHSVCLCSDHIDSYENSLRANVYLQMVGLFMMLTWRCASLQGWEYGDEFDDWDTREGQPHRRLESEEIAEPQPPAQQQPEQECLWPRGGRRCCGSLRTPGAANGWREDETDHCFPASASDHHVCCVDIQDVDNELNAEDPTVARHNPLAEPIRRNSHKSSYSWCTCSETICEKQLKGRVAWVGKPLEDKEL